MATVNFYLEKRKDKKTGEIKQDNVPILLQNSIAINFSLHSSKYLQSVDQTGNGSNYSVIWKFVIQ
ncbi:MAG: hypothetical protein FVQ77_10355 [Cytophagales bacterium]|nr:hypothetical protein [Cytophagales bacterium]